MKTMYVLGTLTLDSATLVLYRGPQPLNIPMKVVQVLLVLLEHPGVVVSRDMLRTQAWPATHVSEGNLTNAISLLRDILRQEGGRAGDIQTFSKRGYLLTLPLSSQPRKNAEIDQQVIVAIDSPVTR